MAEASGVLQRVVPILCSSSQHGFVTSQSRLDTARHLARVVFEEEAFLIALCDRSGLSVAEVSSSLFYPSSSPGSVSSSSSSSSSSALPVGEAGGLQLRSLFHVLDTLLAAVLTFVDGDRNISKAAVGGDSSLYDLPSHGRRKWRKQLRALVARDAYVPNIQAGRNMRRRDDGDLQQQAEEEAGGKDSRVARDERLARVLPLAWTYLQQHGWR